MIEHDGKHIGVEEPCQAAQPNWKKRIRTNCEAATHLMPEQPDAAVQPWDFVRESLNA